MKKIIAGQKYWYYNGMIIPQIVTVTEANVFGLNVHRFTPEIGGQETCGDYRLYDKIADVVSEIEINICLLNYYKREMLNAQEIINDTQS